MRAERTIRATGDPRQPGHNYTDHRWYPRPSPSLQPTTRKAALRPTVPRNGPNSGDGFTRLNGKYDSW